MKIIIVGAGITGLATYLFLHQCLNEEHHPDSNDDVSSSSNGEAKPKQKDQIILVEAYDTSKIRQEYLLATHHDHRGRDEQVSGKVTTKEATIPGHAEAPEDADGPTLFTPVTVGAALGIARNGLSVLSRIDGGSGTGDTLRRIRARGHAIEKLVFDCARGWTLGEVDMTDDSTRPTVAGRRSEKKEEEKHIPPMVLIVRRALWEELYESVVRISGLREENAILNKRVIGIDASRGEGEDGSQADLVLVRFGDGSVETADLVLGADGIRSAVRKAMFEKKKDGTGSAGLKDDDEDYVTPVYEGTAGTGGWLPGSFFDPSTPPTASLHTITPNTMHFTFGRSGFMGFAYSGPSPENPQGVAGWWSTYPKPQTPGLPGMTSSASSRLDRRECVEGLLKRHGGWRTRHAEVIMEFLRSRRVEIEGSAEAHTDSASTVNAISDTNANALLDTEYGTYTVRPLPTWSKYGGRVVLLGDAAHALQTSSGQGVSQGLEDAECFARLLAGMFQTRGSREGETTTSEGNPLGEVLRQTASTFEALRRPRIAMIYERSQKMGRMKGQMRLVQEMLAYFFIWVFMSGWGRMVLGAVGLRDTYFEVVEGYDVPQEVERALERRKQ